MLIFSCFSCLSWSQFMVGRLKQAVQPCDDIVLRMMGGHADVETAFDLVGAARREAFEDGRLRAGRLQVAFNEWRAASAMGAEGDKRLSGKWMRLEERRHWQRVGAIPDGRAEEDDIAILRNGDGLDGSFRLLLALLANRLERFKIRFRIGLVQFDGDHFAAHVLLDPSGDGGRVADFRLRIIDDDGLAWKLRGHGDRGFRVAFAEDATSGQRDRGHKADGENDDDCFHEWSPFGLWQKSITILYILQ